jgi:hypothetical protein
MPEMGVPVDTMGQQGLEVDGLGGGGQTPVVEHPHQLRAPPAR